MHIDIPTRVQTTMATLDAAGGRPLIVGGFVRDRIMTKLGLPDATISKDVDLEVRLPVEALITVLRTIGHVDAVGAAFGVLKLTLDDGEQFDVSVPRTESKSGNGHKGFIVEANAELSIAEAAARRDFTMNSVAADMTGLVHDPFNGIEDIKSGILRATSARFVEDPLRVLRGMQFASRFNMHMDATTAAISLAILDEFSTLSAERIWVEWQKWARGAHPSAGLQVLIDTQWIDAFPMLSALQTTEQDSIWHPEGSVWNHTLLAVNQAASIARREHLNNADTEQLVLATLLHDVGKPETTTVSNGRIISHGHDRWGGVLASAFLKGMRAPLDTNWAITNLVGEHMVHTGAQPTPNVVRRLANRLAPHTNVHMLALLVEADASGRSPAPAANPMAEWVTVANSLNIAANGPVPIVLGRHLINAGMFPGPHFGPILKAAFNAQLDGAFTDVPNGLAWIADNT